MPGLNAQRIGSSEHVGHQGNIRPTAKTVTLMLKVKRAVVYSEFEDVFDSLYE